MAASERPGAVVQVAVPVPLRRVFDYRSAAPLPPGARVKVPFGKGGGSAIGVVVSNNPAQGGRRLKRIGEALDGENLFGERLLELLVWAARYYHHPLGEALQTALPPKLRKGKKLADPAPAANSPPGAGDDETAAAEITAAKITLNAQQQAAVDAIAGADGFASFLLHGITGSGKTEVYLEVAKRRIAAGRQVLILVPEIALTPQLVARVRAHLGGDVCALHSALPAEQRYRAWWQARAGRAAAVLGTRSAIFTPLKNPGLIIVDEEHDLSYKQQDGFRYHARDLAIARAKLEGVPVALGSATPSMETRYHAGGGGGAGADKSAGGGRKHRRLVLSARSGAAQLPRIDFIDLKKHRPTDGISAPLLRAIGERLKRGEQSIIFLNRRGFAPVVHCHQCGWQAVCRRCDARMTYHRRRRDRDEEQFRCHHCGRVEPARKTCGECGEELLLLGAGTQRLESYLRGKFPEARIARLDRDRVAAQAKLERELRAISEGKTDLIIGTQLIAKGHDFSRVTLVGVVNSDQGLYSVDFRAPEYLFQQLTQVSGRAGRGAAPGEVLVQTAHPGHPTLQTMRRHDFDAFAGHCLKERRAAGCPPFAHFALWRAESTAPEAALSFLRYAAAVGRRLAGGGGFDAVEIMDAVVSPMEKRAGRYRAQLLVRAAARAPLHRLLDAWLAQMENDRQSRRARWSIDIDPMEMF